MSILLSLHMSLILCSPPQPFFISLCWSVWIISIALTLISLIHFYLPCFSDESSFWGFWFVYLDFNYILQFYDLYLVLSIFIFLVRDSTFICLKHVYVCIWRLEADIRCTPISSLISTYIFWQGLSLELRAHLLARLVK